MEYRGFSVAYTGCLCLNGWMDGWIKEAIPYVKLCIKNMAKRLTNKSGNVEYLVKKDSNSHIPMVSQQ